MRHFLKNLLSLWLCSISGIAAAGDFPSPNDLVLCYYGVVVAQGETTGGLTVASITTSQSAACSVDDDGYGTGQWIGQCPTTTMTPGSSYSFEVTYSDTSTKTLSFSCADVAIGPVDDTVSTISVSPPVVQADGMSASEVTVQLLTADSDPIPGKEVSVTSSRGSSDTLSAISAITDQVGRAVFSIVSYVVGVATLTATDETDSVTLVSTAEVEFVEPTPTPSPDPWFWGE